MKRFFEKIAVIIAALKKTTNVFLGNKKGKEKKMVAGVSIFRGGTWLIVFATASAVAFLRKIGFSYFWIFIIFWIGNMILTGSTILVNKKTQIDFTSMEGSRNLLKETFKKSKILGFLLECWMFFITLAYSGPDQFIIFFEERISSREMKILIFILASLCYTTIWTIIFVKGADGFWDLLAKLYG